MLYCNRDNCWAWRKGNICVVMPSKPDGKCPSFFDKADTFPRPACQLRVGDRAIIMMPGPYYKQVGTVVRITLLELYDRAYQVYYIKTEDGCIQDYFDDEVDSVAQIRRSA